MLPPKVHPQSVASA